MLRSVAQQFTCFAKENGHVLVRTRPLFTMFRRLSLGNRLATLAGEIAETGHTRSEERQSRRHRHRSSRKLNIEAIENTVVFQIKKEDQIKLFVEYPKFNRIFRVLCENAYIAGQKRILLNISASAEEKYQNFLDEYHHLYHRISNVQIASYIGVTPEFLSAIRKRRSKS